jgi:hypothetical protein
MRLTAGGFTIIPMIIARIAHAAPAPIVRPIPVFIHSPTEPPETRNISQIPEPRFTIAAPMKAAVIPR